jgi:putative mRNA 3-end processing factor
VIAVLRQCGYDRPIYLHGAHVAVCKTYQALGVDLGELRPATASAKEELKGAIVLAPPSAIADRWARRLEDPVVCMASGWMRIRQRAKAGGIELPLIISDHADWDDLLRTIREVGAPEIWVTHGAEEALIHAASRMQIRARALSLVGYGDAPGLRARPQHQNLAPPRLFCHPPGPGARLRAGRHRRRAGFSGREIRGVENADRIPD